MPLVNLPKLAWLAEGKYSRCNVFYRLNETVLAFTQLLSSIGYPKLVYTKTVDSIEGVKLLILCYLPPSNAVGIRDRGRNYPN